MNLTALQRRVETLEVTVLQQHAALEEQQEALDIFYVLQTSFIIMLMQVTRLLLAQAARLNARRRPAVSELDLPPSRLALGSSRRAARGAAMPSPSSCAISLTPWYVRSLPPP